MRFSKKTLAKKILAKKLLAKKIWAKKILALPASLALLAGVAHSQAGVIYTSGGFEPAADFSTTGATTFGDSDASDLYGQGNPYWAPTANPPSSPYNGNGVPADVVLTPASPVNANGSATQVVELNRSTSSVDTRWAPSTFLGANAYQPLASADTRIVDINWDMDVASGGSNDLFGIELNNNGTRIAYATVDTSGYLDDDHAGTVTQTTSHVGTGTWAHYDLRANFSTQTYQIFVNGSLVPADAAVAFEDPATAFTDASLVSYSADGGPGSGIAYYDNYVISSAPEPTARGAILAGCGLLIMRRRRPGSAT